MADVTDALLRRHTLGRGVGDQLLRIVGKRLEGCTREGDLVDVRAPKVSEGEFACREYYGPKKTAGCSPPHFRAVRPRREYPPRWLESVDGDV